MVDSIKKFPRSLKCALIGAQVVLVCGLHLSMAKDLRDFFPAQPSLYQSSASRSSQTSKTQPVRLTVRDARRSTSRFEGSFDGSYAKDQLVVVLRRLLPQGFEFQTQPITYRNRARLSCLSNATRKVDLCLLNKSPLQLEDLTSAHSGIDRANQDRPKVGHASGASGKQSRLFVERKNARTFSLLRNRDDRVAFAERTLHYPPFALCDVQQSAYGGEFAVDTGKGPRLASFGFSFKSVAFVGLEIGVRDRTDSAVAEKRVECLGVALDRITGSETGNLSIIDVNRIDRIAIQIPLHDVSENRAGIKGRRRIQDLAFFKSFAQSFAGLGFACAGSPESFALTVFHPGNACVNVAVPNDNLNLMFPGHLLLTKLYIRLRGCDGERNVGTDSAMRGIGNASEMKDIDVLCSLRQDNEREVDLTSDQKVAGSSPAGCTKNLSKSSLSKNQITSYKKYYPARYTFEKKAARSSGHLDNHIPL